MERSGSGDGDEGLDGETPPRAGLNSAFPGNSKAASGLVLREQDFKRCEEDWKAH